jgi:metal-dependent HD superfamily phosphatase/phosphodiesterase
MAIRDVILDKGEKPLRLTVVMDNPAGVFQVQAVLEKKISTSGLRDHIEIDVMVNGNRLVLTQVKRLFRVQQMDPSPEISVKEK